jgi:hypothetical protein
VRADFKSVKEWGGDVGQIVQNNRQFSDLPAYIGSRFMIKGKIC